MTASSKPGPKPTGKTPPRSIRVSDADWDAFKAKAAKAGKSVTQWLVDLAKAAKCLPVY